MLTIPFCFLVFAVSACMVRFSMHGTRHNIAYFQFIQPTTGTEWINGQTNPVIWKKGLLDGVPTFDLELARLSEDGLILVALNGASPPAIFPSCH